MKTLLRRGWMVGGLAALAALLAPPGARAQDNYEPHWVTLRITDSYLQFDSEFEQQNIASSSGGVSTIWRRIYLSPAIGVDAVGSVYHPNLFAYTLEAAPGYEYQKLSSGGGGSSTENSVIQNYRGSGTLFQTMPFATTIQGSLGHQVQDYDIFNTVTVDSSDLGVSTGYKDGPIPFSLTYDKSHQDTTGIGEEQILDQQNLDLHARNERFGRDYTDLTYHYGTLDETINQNSLSLPNNSSYQIANLNDVERWGPDERYSLNDTVLYNELDMNDAPARTVSTLSNFGMDLTPRLRNTYEYAFTDYSDNTSDYQQYYGRAALRHRLFDSLSSALEVHGGHYSSDTSGSTVDSSSIGVLASLDYRKTLGNWGHLAINNFAQYDYTDQTSSGGLSLIPNEAHVISITPTPLNQPQDVSLVRVTDASQSKNLVQGVDFSMNTNVQPWEIQIIPTSLNLKSGDTVLVTYEVQANPTGNYSTIQNQFQVRLDLFQHLLSLYTRMLYVNNYTNAPGFVLENLTEWQAGAAFEWRGLHLNADYDDRSSSLNYSYTTEALTEGYQTPVFLSDCSCSLDFHQRWTDYPDQDQRATYYDFVGRFQWHPTAHLSCTVEGGLQRQRGRGLDQDLSGARTHLDWVQGRLTLNLGYEYTDENFAGERRQRNFVFLRMKRRF